jgi:hypothetical protein
MANSNEKFVQDIVDGLSDLRLSMPVIANQIACLPYREQVRFFQLIISYIDMMDKYRQRGYAIMGLQSVVKACGDLMEVLKQHFPIEDNQLILEGMEYIAL